MGGKYRMNKENLDRIFLAKDMLPEDVQDQSCPMFLIGTDVANLYPSLDIHQVVDEVQRAMLDSTISWDNIDYLEATRYIALNWTKEECEKSDLRRVLPRRR